MKRAWLFVALGLTYAQATTQQTAQQYGQDVLKAYAAKGRKAASGQSLSLPCDQLLPYRPNIWNCTVHVWGKQAVAEVSYPTTTEPDSPLRQLWVGHMKGIASDLQLWLFRRAVVKSYIRWTESAAYGAWAKTQPPAPQFGYTQDCSLFYKAAYPAGVKRCIQGSGPADGPTVTVELVDGRILLMDVG